VALIDRFESIARRAKMGRIGYRHTVDQKAAKWQKLAAESSTKNHELSCDALDTVDPANAVNP